MFGTFLFCRPVVAILTLALFCYIQDVPAQSTLDYDESLYSALEYRSIGPYRGGRSAAVAGIPGNPTTFFFGSTGGGVWKTTDAGQTWDNLSDGYFGGSIGAVAVSEWDSNVIYVGGGEKTVRGNVSHGYGVYKTLDGGKTWTHMGLSDSRHIPRIRIHPKNPNLVYAAVMGHLFGPSQERGIYRSKDGGETWEQVLFANEEAGAVDLNMDPSNPRVLFASTWRIRRTPHSLESGGEGSGLWKSTDGGDTWTDITHNEGLPQGMIGIIGVTVSPVNPSRIWANIEAADGGVFRSDDGGETWTRINEERKLRQRAWYYTRIYADTQNEDVVYVLNVRFWRSKDGGKTYESISTPHGDHHDLWIDPMNADRMIIGDDGGGQVSLDGGDNFSTYHNQPTAQFYRVTTDNHFPYRVLGAQQDNSTVRILHRSNGSTITERHWESTAGGESGWLAPHPENPDIVFGGSYGGYLTRVNHATNEVRAVTVWPDNPMGHGAEGMNPRFQWNFPILFSPHKDANINDYPLYAAGNILYKSLNEGQSWTAISPDLTRNDPGTLGTSGGPITKDNTGVEYYATIFALAESKLEPGVIWAGSDDGLVHITRNGGTNWTNITPPESIFPEWMMVNEIELHPTDAGRAYLVGTRYKLDDFKPYLYKTTDHGQTWTSITNGIDDSHFTRALTPDPNREGLLYAGTESGMYISFDDGASWKPFQQNLPLVPITDLTIKDNDLIVATQGRSFWIIDDLTPLHQLTDAIAQADHHLFSPRPTYRMRGGTSTSKTAGQNPPNGVMIHYHFAEAPDSNAVHLDMLENDGTLIKRFSPTDKTNALSVEAGMNRFVWNMRYPDAEGFEGLIMWAGSLTGPRAIPGNYKARLIVGEDSSEVNFEIKKDPRATATQEDLMAQFDALMEIREKLTETHQAIKNIREVRSQVSAVTERLPDDHAGADEIKDAGKTLNEKLTAVEEALYQTKNQSRQDPLNFPIRLNNKLSALGGVISVGDHLPTDQAMAFKEEVTAAIDTHLATFRDLMATDVPAFNDLVREKSVPAIMVKKDKKSSNV